MRIPVSTLRAGIHTKNTGLDGKQYDKQLAEEEELLSHYQNRIKNAEISENERNEIIPKIDALMKKRSDNSAELENNRRFIDFDKVKFPEVNPIELVRPDY